jgi:hypothetical protein
LELTNAEITALNDIQRVITAYEKAHIKINQLLS